MDLLEILNLANTVVRVAQFIWDIVSAIVRKCRKKHES